MIKTIHTKMKYNIDIGPLINEGTIAKTEWNTKEEDFLWALGPEAKHQIT